MQRLLSADEELGAVRAFLERVADGPGALVHSGEVGIGKTIPWQTGVEDARERLDRVLTCHGVEAEASLSFAGLSDLLGSVLEEAGALACAPATARARNRAAAGRTGEVAPNPHAIGLVLDILRVLAEQGSVLGTALDPAEPLDVDLHELARTPTLVADGPLEPPDGDDHAN